MIDAARRALEEELKAATCAVCGSEKWAWYPFCRSCSIKLQRAGMMRELKHYRVNERALVLASNPGTPVYVAARADRFFTLFDIARDFLMNRGGAHGQVRSAAE